MTLHRTLLVLVRRGPLAGHHNRHIAASVTCQVSSSANIHTTPSVQAGMSMSMTMQARSMTTMVHWPGDGDPSMSPARTKLQHVLEEYRQNKYVHYVHATCTAPQPCSPRQAFCAFLPFRWFSHLSLSLSFFFVHVLHYIFTSTCSFSQTLFSRFLKGMIHATDANHDGYISRSELSKLLDNIGAKGKLLDTEVQEIMDELGQMDEEQQELLIHIENLEDVILKGVH
jgi:hypothetical protein